MNAVFLSLKYADDVVLISPSAAHLQDSVETCWLFGKKRSDHKRKKPVYMVIRGGMRKSEQLSIRVKETVLEQVTEFTYLGFILNEKLSSTEQHARQCQKTYYAFRR